MSHPLKKLFDERQVDWKDPVGSAKRMRVEGPVFATTTIEYDHVELQLDTDVTIDAAVQWNDEAYTYDFDISLGPANAKKLIEFLFKLKPELDVEDT